MMRMIIICDNNHNVMSNEIWRRITIKGILILTTTMIIITLETSFIIISILISIMM